MKHKKMDGEAVVSICMNLFKLFEAYMDYTYNNCKT